jgi:hypothetical protein
MSSLASALLALTSQATAASPWVGEWGLDPSRSDEPSQMIERAYSGPALSNQGAGRYSPDGGEVDHEAERGKVLYEALALLGASGRLSLAPGAEGRVALGWGDGQVLELESGRRWTKVTSDDGDRYRIRVVDLGEQLLVERRAKLTEISETLIPSDQGDLVAVVRVDGNTLESGVEFRRVYRRLE